MELEEALQESQGGLGVGLDTFSRSERFFTSRLLDQLYWHCLQVGQNNVQLLDLLHPFIHKT